MAEAVRRKALTCESVTTRALKAGLVSTDGDVLATARGLDSLITTSEQQHSQPFRGVPVLVLNARPSEIDVVQRLSAAGLLVFNDVDRRQHGGEVRHPRDAAFPLMAPCGPAAAAGESTAVAAASALSAVAAGAASAALLSAPASVPAAVLVRQCASWAGVTTYEGPAAGGTMYCASSVADLRAMAALLTDATQAPLTPTTPRPLAGLRVAFVSDRPLYNLDAACEDAVARSVAVAADVLKSKLGAEVTKLKAASLRGAADAADLLAGYDLLLSPAYAVGPGSDACAAGASAAVGDGFAAGLLLGRETLCLPCGMIATEDDGYGGDNDQAEREGLPVSMLLTALATPTSSSTTAEHGLLAAESAVLRAGAAYENITRWGSDLFAPGRPRLYVKEDMDDARESFGIYFVDSLLKYMGKRIATS